MKYWILPFLLSSSMLAISQSSNHIVQFMQSGVDEPLALLDRPEGTEFEISQPLPRLQRALGCDAQVFLTEDPIPPGTYEASQQIVATGVVQSGTVNMRAAIEVILDSDASGDFEVQAGAVLEITMGACTL